MTAEIHRMSADTRIAEMERRSHRIKAELDRLQTEINRDDPAKFMALYAQIKALEAESQAMVDEMAEIDAEHAAKVAAHG